MKPDSRIYVAGHRGMVGSAILRKLEKEGFKNVTVRTSAELDLRNQAAVNQFFEDQQPEFVFMSAAKVGGIVANNTYRADFIYDNVMIEANVIKASHEYKVAKMLFLGSSCIYPKLAPQPLKEEYLLEGYLEQTNEPYAIAKIAGVKMAEAFRDQYDCNFISAMPTNLYGPNDNYDLQNSHVLPALLRKFHSAAKEGKSQLEIWGTGSPKREFLHVNDLADASLFLMQNYNGRGFVNVGSGTDVSIKELAEMIAKTIGFKGDLVFNTSKPDGTPRKLMDVSRLHGLGWKHTIQLEEGIRAVYDEMKNTEVFNHSA
ncbi:GDP-L-fucose synthase [Salibacteraceae bacterium]|nr:GDP-L-fucose synthase [Salibacteraceae bacterium]MDB4104087.1 GDP-L-fucose synthase [Salibacteraceae bacterium]MDB9709125.1 GDP-L-fucose synthase [Salibacteraceae bacterium]